MFGFQVVLSAPVFVAASQQSDNVNDPTGILLQYGVLGLGALVLLWFARVSYKREVDRADRLEAEVLRLNNLIQEKHIPALESATHALRDATEIIRDYDRDIRRIEPVPSPVRRPRREPQGDG